MTIQVQNPQTGQYVRMGREDAIRVLTEESVPFKWGPVVTQFVLWIAFATYAYGASLLVGWAALLAGLPLGAFLSWVWRTR